MAIAELIMPKMGESIMEATILRWHKKVGDPVKQDETILDIATDKVDSEIPSPTTGFITELLYPVNSVVPVGSVIAKIQTEVSVGQNAATAFKPIQPSPVYEQPQPIPAPAPVYYQQPQQVPAPPVQQPIAEIPFQPQMNTIVPKTGNNRFFSPLVLNIANSEGISLSELERIPGTGADGRVSKKDVVQYIADKRAGKIPAYTTAAPTPVYAPTTAFRAPQPAVYIQEPTPAPVEQYPPVYIPSEPIAPIANYKSPVVEAAPQPIISTFPATSSDTITSQPLVVNNSEVPNTGVPLQPIVDFNPFAQPGFLPVQPIATSVPATPVVESIPVQPIANNFPTPIVETIPAQPLVEQSIVAELPNVPQPIVAPIVEKEHSTVFVEPIIPSVVVPAQTIVEPVIFNQSSPTLATELSPQPLIQNGNNKAAQSGFTAQPIVPSGGTPSLENKYASLQPVASYSTGQPENKATPSPITTNLPTSGNSSSSVGLEPLSSGSSSNKSADIKPLFGKPIDKSFVGVQQHAKNLKPVYLVPPATPDVPLVTLAEGSSGKFTTPESAHPSGNVEIIEMDRMRKLIAKHMVDSKHTSPHVTSFTEADVTNMVFWRERVKSDFEKREGTKLTFTPMFIDCLVKVMKKYPLINSSVEGDKIIIKKDINIGMATALPTGNLIVPVIKGADQLNIVGLSAAVNKLANDARNNQLKPDDVSGGTFTFTNVGTFGTLMGTPIINQPQVAILAVGMIKKRPVVIESPDNDTIGIRHMMYLSLSYDHRVIDGSVGASFLTELAKEFEQWDLNRTWYHYL